LGKEIHLIGEKVDFRLEYLLVCQQLCIVSFELDVLRKGFRILRCQQVDRLLQLGQDVNSPLLFGGEPGHDGPDCATGEQKHEQILQYLGIHI
jgi:hypothetical protein